MMTLNQRLIFNYMYAYIIVISEADPIQITEYLSFIYVYEPYSRPKK